ncbi:hypothetical protein SETIT_8G133600v2 [Setaria italica]|uniref:Uncharacterized protein n=1 Tax=Setaria italica TaxID=4555 RepID=A0A368S7C1_SETIT|nr:hypothetical protein SETIT_8G133600v2 [Setaria italica]
MGCHQEEKHDIIHIKFHPYSSWGWNDPWAHTPSYFRPYHVEYAAPREPSCARQIYVENDRFEKKDRSSGQKKKKVVKQVYRVKRDGRKNKSSDLDSISEKIINVLSTLATNGKGKEKSVIDPPRAKSEKNKLKAPKNKKRALLSKTKAKSSYPLGLSNWQKKKLQKLSVPELRKKSMAWVRKGSIQIQNKDDVQAMGAT